MFHNVIRDILERRFTLIIYLTYIMYIDLNQQKNVKYLCRSFFSEIRLLLCNVHVDKTRFPGHPQNASYSGLKAMEGGGGDFKTPGT